MRPAVARGGGLACALPPPEPRRGRGNRRGDLGGAVRGAGRSRVSCTLCSAPVVRHLSGGAAHLLARGDRGGGCRPCESVSPELAPRAGELVAARLPFRDDVGDWHAARAAAGLPVGAHAGAPLVGGGRGDGERVPAARRARATTAPDAHTAGGGPRRPALRGPRQLVAGPSPLVPRPCWMLQDRPLRRDEPAREQRREHALVDRLPAPRLRLAGDAWSTTSSATCRRPSAAGCAPRTRRSSASSRRVAGWRRRAATGT